MSEARARKAVYARSGGQCEMTVDVADGDRWVPERCPSRRADWSHRWGRGTGGRWTPANGLALCRPCHAWLHESPTRARAGGWALLSDSDPATAPVWLPAPFPAWWLLVADPPDGGEHLIELAALGPAPAVNLRRVTPAVWAA